MAKKRRLLDCVRDVIWVKNYSYRTEKAYVHWIKRYILYHQNRHPETLGNNEAAAFLTHLAVDDNVAASTQNQNRTFSRNGLLVLRENLEHAP